ncbi:MAG TPA: hypothetical protein VM261_14415 [Kofleriaceae bacterium]|nr:hypothetical protein [Kofleriaceae bacterium]
MKTTTRSILSVLAGLVTIFAASSAVDAVLHATGFYPPVGDDMSDGKFVVAFAYRLVIGIAGCWLTARLAPARPMKHALVLGGIGVVLATLGAAAMWSHGHHWYPVGLIASSLPSAWLGASLEARAATSVVTAS